MCSRTRWNGPRTAALVVVSFVCLIMIAAGTPAMSQQADVNAAKALSNTFAAVAKAALPAVVSIKVEKTVEAAPLSGFEFNDPFGQFNDEFLRKFFGGRLPNLQGPNKYQERAQGSGFIISDEGYILTNNHVVGSADKITVELQDGRRFENARLIGTDPESEVALIKIEGDHFPVLPLGDSGTMQIGDWVMAIGNPFGLSQTVTVGVISAVGRSNVHLAAYEDFIQTDAAINPGNSGGPLIDLDGRAIGINTAIYSQSGGYMGIGFAVPIDMAKSIEKQLLEKGKVTRGYLGLYGQDVTPDMAALLDLGESGGIIVSEVIKDSPVDGAGLKAGDVIVEMNGSKIDTYDSFRNDVAMLAPGTNVRLLVLRDGKQRRFDVKIAERSAAVAASAGTAGEPKAQLGMQVQNLNKELADQFGYPLGEGVIVTAVEPGSVAGSAGIEPGDLILSVNRTKVNSVDEFGEAIAKSEKDKKVMLLVKHGEYSRFVVLRFE
jgi:serine protease Do